MKNIFKNTSKVLAAGILIWSATSCKDFLDLQPQDRRTEENFYRTQADAEEALAGVYDVVAWSAPSIPEILDNSSDDGYKGGSDISDSPLMYEFDQHRIAPTNTINGDLYRNQWYGISRANLLLANMEGIDMPEDAKNRIMSEAKFLRAHFYMTLVRFYENIPLITEPLAGVSQANQPQATPEMVWNQIATDLEDAIALLPAVRLNQNSGRATKYSAEALLARGYLFYKGVYNKELQAGNVVVNSQRALQHLQDIINTSSHSLTAVYDSIWTKHNEFNNESVWEISYSDALLWGDWGFTNGGEGNMQPQRQGPRVKTPATEKYFAGWSFVPVSQSFYNAFAANDPRRNASILIVEEELSGELNIGFQNTGYFSDKYTTTKEYAGRGGTPELNRGNNYRAIRYADVLLMAAELSTMTGADGQEYLDAVRQRVGLDPIPATLDNIYNERHLELGLEGIRYWDLLRQGMPVAQQALTQNIRGPRYTDPQVNYEINFNPATRGFFPIPQSEIDLSGGVLKQNAGYNQ